MDIDGTVLRTNGAGLGALNTAFEEVFRIPDAFEGISFVGSMDSVLFETVGQKHLGRSMTSPEIEALVASYTHELEMAFEVFPFEVLSGVVSTLEALQKHPTVHLGLATGNVKEAAWAKLRKGKLDGYFEVGGYGLDGARRAEMTQVAWTRSLDFHNLASTATQGFLIGDSIYDMECARTIGVTAIGITTGWSDEQTLRDAGAHVVIDCFDGLLDLLT